MGIFEAHEDCLDIFSGAGITSFLDEVFCCHNRVLKLSISGMIDDFAGTNTD